jgi:hypothetical protein
MAAVATADVFYYSDNYCHTVLGQTKWGDVPAVINYTTSITEMIYNDPQSIQFKLQKQDTGSGKGLITYLSLSPTTIPVDMLMNGTKYATAQFTNNIFNLWTRERHLWSINVKDLPPSDAGYKFVSNVTYAYNFTKMISCSYGYGFSLSSSCYAPLFPIMNGKQGCSVYNGSFGSAQWKSINYY